jgi:hypothetical protein
VRHRVASGEKRRKQSFTGKGELPAYLFNITAGQAQPGRLVRLSEPRHYRVHDQASVLKSRPELRGSGLENKSVQLLLTRPGAEIGKFGDVQREVRIKRAVILPRAAIYDPGTLGVRA